MTNIFKSENLSNDFDAFCEALLKTNTFVSKITKEIKPILKKHHNYIYNIAVFQTKLEDIYRTNFHKYAFITEIQSDLLSNISLIFLGFHHQSQTSFRRIIENFYNHIFFFDHSVEFEQLNDGRNEYQPIFQLKEYADAHPVFKNMHEDQNLKLFNQNIFNQYHELCRTVHTKGIDFMGLAKTIEETKVNIDIVKYLNSINLSLSHLIYILFKFHNDISYTHVEKDLIAKSFSKTLRSTLLIS